MPRLVQRLRIVEFTLDHEAPYVSNMRRRNSRKDSDLNGVVDVRYTGGARMLLALEVGEGRWRFKVPVLVSDLDVECALWLKVGSWGEAGFGGEEAARGNGGWKLPGRPAAAPCRQPH
jgi:hypothetical protein